MVLRSQNIQQTRNFRLSVGVLFEKIQLVVFQNIEIDQSERILKNAVLDSLVAKKPTSLMYLLPSKVANWEVDGRIKWMETEKTEFEKRKKSPY